MRDPHNGQSIPAGLTEWRSESLKSITTLMTNGFVGIATPFYVAKDGVPYFMANNVRANELDPKDHTLVSHEFHKRSARSRLRPGDILTVQTGHIGVSCLVPPEWDESNAHALIISRCDPARADSRFVCQYLNSWFGRRELWRIQTGGGRPHLNTTDMMHVRVLVPPPPVQSVIADVLDCYDQAAIRVRRLAVARRKLKRGLLQQLLTGQRRFPEFRKKQWVERPLSAFFTEVDVSNANGAETLVLSCTKLYGIISQMERFERRIASASISHYKVVKRGQLVYDPMLLWDRSIGFVKGYDSGVVSPAYATFAINSEFADPDFFEALFDSHFMRHQYKVISKGTNQRRRKAEPRDFLGVRVLVPPTVEEQRRIGEFVRTCDQELDGLKALHSALKQQKTGLMQRLLTGQVRVPASVLKEAAHA